MARQYGAPALLPGQKESDPSRKDPAPKTNVPDPSPAAELVKKFHKNAQVDTRPEDIHHTLGTTGNNASPGNHTHDGGTSSLILSGVVITGSRGGNLALASVIGVLVKMGAKDSTT
jgi:hypothetical protein